MSSLLISAQELLLLPSDSLQQLGEDAPLLTETSTFDAKRPRIA